MNLRLRAEAEAEAEAILRVSMNVGIRTYVLRGFFLALALAAPALARAQTDVIRGRVTNSDDMALPSVRVIATSIPGNVTRETRTDARGNFQIVFPNGTGDYMMGYALIGYVYRQQQVKRLADEEVLIANASLDVVQLDTIAVVAPVQQRVGRNSNTPDVGGTERPINTDALPPELQGDIAAMAASLPGVLLVPGIEGGADGFSVLGLGADQNSVTLNGMEFGSNGLPRDAAISTSLTTSPYDPSRGGFSGGNFNIRTGSGSNFRTVGVSMVLNTPELQWTDRAASALGQQYTNVSLGGRVSGPLVLNKIFYNTSWQLGRMARDNQTLLGTSPIGLQTAGVASDSVQRLVTILQSQNVPGLFGPVRGERITDNGSLLGSIDISPPNSTSGSSYGVTLNGNWGRQSPVFGGTTQLGSASGDRYNWGAGVQARHGAYIKLVLTETTVGANLSHTAGDPYLDLPAGRVRVTSRFADGSSSVQNLTFGGAQSLSSSSRSSQVSFQNTLSWFDEANKHRVKLTTEARYSGSNADPSNNLRGTFTFNSLEDLAAGIPASFTRTLSVRERNFGQYNASIALGDSYRRTQDIQLQYGIRVDAMRHAANPQFNPAVQSAFGLRNDRIPTPIAFSPRFGFSWVLGDANEISIFSGEARRPRAVVRGGVGVFANAGGGPVGSVLDQTGLPSGTQQIVCVGTAAPVPVWDLYDDPTAIPAECADGSAGSPFSNSSPNVTLFAPNFTPPRSVRGNLSWSGAMIDGRFNASLEGSYSLNLRQQRGVDLNFDNVTRFTLADESRPVFVAPTSIDTASGSIAARDARITSQFARVNQIRSDLQSRTTQGSIRISPIIRGPRNFTWSGAYTYTHVREQVSGFTSTSSSPLGVEWFPSAQGPHQITYNFRYLFFDAVTVNWNGSFRAGSAYTPMVGGDVNGDGYFNDRAFLYDTAASADGLGNPVAAGMTALIASTSEAARSCLLRQLGRIAARNSCRGPWSSSASLNITLDRARFRMPQRANVSFSLSNPLGAADLVVNGSDNLRGWGQNPSPDQTLLYVRGFDVANQRYIYEVNQRFGATRPQFTALRSPVVLTTSIRIDLGPTREKQNVEQWIGAGRDRPGSKNPANFYRNQGPSAVLNPLSAILRQQDSLQLTTLQADSIAVLNRRYTYRTDSIWAPVAQYLGALGNNYDTDEAYDRYRQARRAQVDMLIRMAPIVNALLTPAQRRKLPGSVVNYLDHRYLRSIRNGSNTFVGGGGGNVGFGGGGFEFFTPAFGRE